MKTPSERLRVLSVAYPFAPVGRNAVGGAEQVLAMLDDGLVQRGHTSKVVAMRGSVVAGELVEVLAAEGEISDFVRAQSYDRHRAAIDRVLDTSSIDLVHMHGVDFHQYLPDRSTPVLVTLHLPTELYPVEVFANVPPHVTLQCVSASQRAACSGGLARLECVENGVAVESFAARRSPGGYALMLARICEEKGVHLGLEAAHSAGVALRIGGEVFPYPAHIGYFENRVRPLLDSQRRFLGPLGFERKRRLLAGARCVLIPSLVPETSSLVAMEALASGTPVIAFRTGALTEIVDHGLTGFLVHDAREMADAIHQAARLNPEDCRAVARVRFSADAMVERYLELYRRTLQRFPIPLPSRMA